MERFATLAINEQGEKVIQIKFAYDVDLLFKVRSIPGRKYHSEQDCWSAPLYLDTVNLLINWGFTLDSSIDNYINHANIHSKIISSENGIPGLKGILRPFQSEVPIFIDQCNGRALIADEMGLGKTIETLAWLQLHRDRFPVIIICPATVKINWAREIEAWLPNAYTEILSGTKSHVPLADFIIINYDILVYWVDDLKRVKPQIVVTDECHKYKTSKARRTKAVKRLMKGMYIPYFIALSGTPIENRPAEIYNAVHIINPDILPSDEWHFWKRYCNLKHDEHGWDRSGTSNAKELHDLLTGSVMLRRLKKDVLKDLPDKVYSLVPMEISNGKEYRFAERDFIEYVRQEKGQEAADKASNAKAFTSIEGLKQLAVKGKIKQAIEWINDFLEIDGKLVVFATHKFVIDILMEEFKTIAVKIDGSVSMTQRQKAVDAFQNNPEVRLFVGNIQAAGVGITLTAASSVAFLELPWMPGELTQAEDRLHRIGQKDSVNVYYLFASGTVEEKIAHLLDVKRKVLSNVLDGKDGDTSSLFKELIKSYRL